MILVVVPHLLEIRPRQHRYQIIFRKGGVLFVSPPLLLQLKVEPHEILARPEQPLLHLQAGVAQPIQLLLKRHLLAHHLQLQVAVGQSQDRLSFFHHAALLNQHFRHLSPFQGVQVDRLSGQDRSPHRYELHKRPPLHLRDSQLFHLDVQPGHAAVPPEAVRRKTDEKTDPDQADDLPGSPLLLFYFAIHHSFSFGTELALYIFTRSRRNIHAIFLLLLFYK